MGAEVLLRPKTSHWKAAYYHVSVLEIKDSIKNGDRLPISEDVPDKAKSLIAHCWNGSPRGRPAFAEILDRLQQAVPDDVTRKTSSKSPTSPKLDAKSQSKKDKKTFQKKQVISKRMLMIGLAFFVLVLLGTGIGVLVATLSSKSTADVPDIRLETVTTYPTKITTSTSTSKTISRTPFPTATITTHIQDSTNLDFIYGMAIDEEDNLYVISATDRKIHKVSQTNDGVQVSLIAPSQSGFVASNQGLCYHNRALYLPRGGQLSKIDLDNGNLITRFAGSGQRGPFVPGKNGSATFCGAIACTVDQEGNIYVSETCNAIRKVTPTGEVSNLRSNLPHFALSLVINGSDNLLFTGWSPDTVYSLNLTSRDAIYAIVGNFSTSCPRQNGQGLNSSLCGPSGLALDELGNLYISESEAFVVAKVDTSLSVTVFAGSGVAGNIDDVGIIATFRYPRHLVFDSKGRLFVAEQRNDAIRMINW